MKRIIASLAMIVAVGTVLIGATFAVFSSQAAVEGNTFATGELEIRVNGQASIPGFNFSNAAPGDCKVGQFGVNNYGAPYFAGPSTLPAKELVVSSAKTSGSNMLYNALNVKVEANRGWATKMLVYEGPLSGLSEDDLLAPRWTELIAGSSEDVYYEVCLPASAGDALQGKSTTFDFVIDAYNPVR